MGDEFERCSICNLSTEIAAQLFARSGPAGSKRTWHSRPGRKAVCYGAPIICFFAPGVRSDGSAPGRFQS